MSRETQPKETQPKETQPTAADPTVDTLTAVQSWSTQDAEELFHLPAWGSGYFFVNEEGHVAVRPVWNQDISFDLFEVAQELKARGIQFPMLIRLQDLLNTRVVRLNEAFRKAIAVTGFRNQYQGVFPIKVNQLREVVEEILDAGAPYKFGLECGSKPELVAALPYLEEYDTLLICNGSKDAVMMRLMLSGQQLGKNIVPVIERFEEFEMLHQLAQEMEVTAQFGVRVRLSTSGAGLWSESGGENSKFGLSLTELIKLTEQLKRIPTPYQFKLLHFHLGSQIAEVQNVRHAVQEAARVYTWLRREGFAIEYFDIGGGLGVSYDTGHPSLPGSINYSMDDYTHAVVESLKKVCDDEKVRHPTLVSESGRAITAHHSVLLVEVVGTRTKDVVEPDGAPVAGHAVLDELSALVAHFREEAEAPGVEDLEDIRQTAERLRARVTDLFRLGTLSVAQKAQAERYYWSVCHWISDHVQRLDPGDVPAELAALDADLVDQDLCNFSVFRSMLDHWALKQCFPILPIHRLDEPPTRRGILVDLTCDSDGKVNMFIDGAGRKHYLDLHALRSGEPYYLGFFLMGAYQDIMGDMHNLFGRVTEIHIYADDEEPGNFYVEEILPGGTVEEQLALVQYYPNDLERRMNRLIRQQVRAGRVRPKEGVRLLEQFRSTFREFSYLNTE